MAELSIEPQLPKSILVGIPGALFLRVQQNEMCGTPRQAVCELLD
jgi:hypothetical protein